MSIASELSTLREWLRADETRLQNNVSGATGEGSRQREVIGNFDDWHNHGNVWPNGPNAPWHDFNNWGKH